MRAVVLRRGEDGFWVAEAPSLPGCISQGKTRPEAIENIKEAIDGWIETAEANDYPLPKRAVVPRCTRMKLDILSPHET